MNGNPRMITVGSEPPPLESAQSTAKRNGRRAGHAKQHRAPANRGGVVKRRFGLLNAFLDRATPSLKRSELAAWMLLFRHAKADGVAKASVADLARRAGCCDSAMRRALKSLGKAGLLERLKRGTLAGGPSVYRLLSPEGDRP